MSQKILCMLTLSQCNALMGHLDETQTWLMLLVTPVPFLILLYLFKMFLSKLTAASAFATAALQRRFCLICYICNGSSQKN